MHTVKVCRQRCDEAHFDGWYASLVDANEIFELFKQRYPLADVFIVTKKKAKFREITIPQSEDVIAAIIEQHENQCRSTST